MLSNVRLPESQNGSGKNYKNGSSRWHEKYNQVAAEIQSEMGWPKYKQMVKDLATTSRAEFWQKYINPLVQQGNLLKLIEAENADLTWISIIYDLPRGVLSFAVRTSIDFLPTFTNFKTWGKRLQTNCKLCSNRETLHHILHHCSISLNQGRFTWRHNSIFDHLLKHLNPIATAILYTMVIYSLMESYIIYLETTLNKHLDISVNNLVLQVLFIW